MACPDRRPSKINKDCEALGKNAKVVKSSSHWDTIQNNKIFRQENTKNTEPEKKKQKTPNKSGDKETRITKPHQHLG